jgi:hypothetical protein
MSEQSAFAAPPPDPELRRLEPLVGTWRAEDHTEDSALGPDVRVASTESFHWLDGGYFLVQTYETVFGDEPAQKGVNYWFYDSDAKRFRIIFFSNNGPFSRTAIATRARRPGARSPSRVRRGSSTSSTSGAESSSTPRARSRWLGGCATTTATGSRG